MPPEDSGLTGKRSRGRALSIWVAPLAVVFGVWLWLAFSAGGFQAHQSLPATLAVGLLGFIVSLLMVYPRRPGQLSLLLLSLFALYAVWVACSALWADSVSRVWMETTRTGGYLLVLALALAFLTDERARRAFRYLLLASASVLLVTCLWKLWRTADPSTLFLENRLSYPVSYSNNAAALFLVAFWPLIWLAASPKERAPIRGVALGLATGLSALAVMTQSRGAVWSLLLSLVAAFVVFPARLRVFVHLLIPGLLLAYSFPALNRYWLEGPASVGGGLAVRTILVASAAVTLIGLALALLERRVNVGRKGKAIVGGVVLVCVVVAGAYGVIELTSGTGGPVKWASQKWGQFWGTAPEGVAEFESETRLTVVSSSGRVDIWRVALESFLESPILGVGADNFVFQYDRLRTRESIKPRHAHSLELQVLGETGLVGGVIAFGGVILAFGAILLPRCSSGRSTLRRWWSLRRRKQSEKTGTDPPDHHRRSDGAAPSGWTMALLVALFYWLVHASVDWLWQMPGVTIPAILILAAAVAETDARADTTWLRHPRLRLHAHSAATRPLAQQPIAVPPAAEPVETASSQHGGIIGLVFRAMLLALSLVVLVSAGLPYLSLQYQKSALALAKVDKAQALDRAAAAQWFQPADPAPYETAASICATAAAESALSGAPDRAGAVLDNLSISLANLEQAIAKEPASWYLWYEAGVTALNTLAATEAALGNDSGLDHETLVSTIPGLADWRPLVGSPLPSRAPGAAKGSLAIDASGLETAMRFRALSKEEVGTLAMNLLSAAKERNPLASQVTEAIRALSLVLETPKDPL